MTNSPSWVSGGNNPLGYPAPGTVDTGKVASDGTTVTGPSVPMGTVAQFRDNGTTLLGGGTFIFLPGVTATVPGDVVTYITADGAGTGVSDGAATVRWTGTANTGYPLAIATAATNLPTKWGWYQIQGSAIVNISGTVTAGNKAYFGQVATLETAAAVAGKQVLNVQAASADGVPETGKAIFLINGPLVQSAIT